MTKEEARRITAKVLEYSSGDDTNVNVWCRKKGTTRFANNRITQNVYESRITLTVSIAFGSRSGSASIDDIDDDSLHAAVKRAEGNARMSRPDSEYMPPVEPCEYLDINSYDSFTAKFEPTGRAEKVRECITSAEKKGLVSAGHIMNGSWMIAVANSNDLFAFHESSFAGLASTAMTDNSSGRAEVMGEDIQTLDWRKAYEKAERKAITAQNPREIKPGKYTVILEPDAVGELLGFMLWQYWAKEADQGVSFMTGKKGTRFLGDNFTFRTNPGIVALPGVPFNRDGFPTSRMTFIKDGVAERLFASRFWAQKTGVAATGWPGNAIVDGEDNSVEDLVRSTERGILVTRLWYVRYVDPMIMLLTGMTRDGTYLVEDGKVKHGIKNLRFNESPLNAFKRIEKLSNPERTGEYYQLLAPAMKIRDFNFTSITKF